jgi:hypothetical protein
MNRGALKSSSLRAAVALLVLACVGVARAVAQEGGSPIHPNPKNARLVWAGEEYLVWQTSTIVPGTEARHLPSAVFRYYVQGDPSDVVPHVYEMTGRLGPGAPVLGVIGKEATLVLADYRKTTLVNVSEALGLPDPKVAVKEIPADWYAEPKNNEPVIGVPLAAYDEGVLATDADSRLIYLIPWSPGGGRLDGRRKLLVGDVRGLKDHYRARDVTFKRGGDLLVWVAGRNLHAFDFKTRRAYKHILAKDLIGDPFASDEERALFYRHEHEGPQTLAYDMRTGRLLPKVFPVGWPPGQIVGMKGGVVYVLERERAADAGGRHAHRVAAHDMKRGGARTPLKLVFLKADAQRTYVHRLFFRDHLFFWDEDRWESVPVE